MRAMRRLVQYSWERDVQIFGCNYSFIEPGLSLFDPAEPGGRWEYFVVFRCLSSTFHRLSTTFRCLSSTFHSLSTTFRCLSSTFHCLPTTFRCLSSTFHCLSTTFRCLSSTFHCLSPLFCRWECDLADPYERMVSSATIGPLSTLCRHPFNPFLQPLPSCSIEVPGESRVQRVDTAPPLRAQVAWELVELAWGEEGENWQVTFGPFGDGAR